MIAFKLRNESSTVKYRTLKQLKFMCTVSLVFLTSKVVTLGLTSVIAKSNMTDTIQDQSLMHFVLL